MEVSVVSSNENAAKQLSDWKLGVSALSLELISFDKQLYCLCIRNMTCRSYSCSRKELITVIVCV